MSRRIGGEVVGTGTRPQIRAHIGDGCKTVAAAGSDEMSTWRCARVPQVISPFPVPGRPHPEPPRSAGLTASSWLSRQPAYLLSSTSTELPARLATSAGATPAFNQVLSAAL